MPTFGTDQCVSNVCYSFNLVIEYYPTYGVILRDVLGGTLSDTRRNTWRILLWGILIGSSPAEAKITISMKTPVGQAFCGYYYNNSI